MNPRKLGLIVGTVALAMVSCLPFLTGTASAQGRLRLQAAPVFQTDGRTVSEFAATCISTSWTQIVSSNTASRSTYVQLASGSGSDTCISVTSNTAGCTVSRVGVELSTWSYHIDHTYYGTAALYCRAAGNTSYVKGYRGWDQAGDQGMVSDPTVQ